MSLKRTLQFFLSLSLSIFFCTSLFIYQAFSENIPPEEIQEQKYRFSPGDVLEIEVFEAEELNRTVRVSSGGFITFPLLGTVKVQGLTERELEERLEGLLEEKYLQAPQVSIFVKEGGYFYVLGKVNNEEGIFPYRPGITLQQAIAMAGGFAGEEADLKGVQITRGINGGIKESFTVDYTLIAEGRLRDIPIMKDDVVFVKGLGKFYVSGFVRNPGGFGLTPNMTLQQAIATAGGIASVGKPSGTQIKRVKEDGGVEVISVNYNEIKDGKVEDLKIKADDLIHVPRSYLLGFVRAFFFSIGLGDRHSVGLNPITFIER
jgi:polysaccharide export outer membrane protein